MTIVIQPCFWLAQLGLFSV